MNNINAFADQPFYEIEPKDKKYTIPLLLSLNSSITALFYELYGRSYGGGVLELAVYECKKLPVLDPRKLKTEELKRIEKMFSEIKENKGNSQEKIDDLMFSILGFSDTDTKNLLDALKDSKKIRSKRVEKRVLVE